MPRTHKKYDEEFKRRAVELYLHSNNSLKQVARKLAEATQRNHLPRLIRTLTKMRLLVLDEVGYLELSKPQASLLFQVISMRYEAGLPIILTSNKAFGDWASVFTSDPVMASAALDRLLHRSTYHQHTRRFLQAQRKAPGRHHHNYQQP